MNRITNHRQPATTFANPDEIQPEALQLVGEVSTAVAAYTPLYESFTEDPPGLSAPEVPFEFHTWRLQLKTLTTRSVTDPDAMAFHLVRAHALAIRDGMAVFSTDGLITFVASLDEISSIQLEQDNP